MVKKKIKEVEPTLHATVERPQDIHEVGGRLEDVSMPIQGQKVKRINKPTVLFWSTVAMVGVALFAFISYTRLQGTSSEVTARRIATIVQKVERLIDVPQDETPSIVTVTDVASLADQPFFKNATKGDIVLLYSVARKAFLYNPKRNIIIEAISLSEDAQP